MKNLILAAGIVLLISCLLCPVCRADSFQVTITTTPIQGQAGHILFDFVAGFPVLNNTVTVSGFTSDAGLGTFTTTGAVSGTLVPGPLMLSDSAFLSEWDQSATFGSTMSFVLTLTTNFETGGIPDEFSFFLADSTGTPYPTSDPTGADALFVIDITGNPLNPMVFTSDYATATVTPISDKRFKVIHTFTGGQDGANPNSGLTMDRAGNFYGTTENGGIGYGAIYKLKHVGSGWVVVPLYNFAGGNDGAAPRGRVIFGPDGSLYGTTAAGGGGGACQAGCGTVFKLAPKPTACASVSCPWAETVLYRFTGGSDGKFSDGEVVFDQPGNIYGTTEAGGDAGYGVVYKLTPSNGKWTESVVYSFPGSPGLQTDYRSASLVFDQMGNLYGTTDAGGTGNQGTVFQLKPMGSNWIANILYSFQGDGSTGVTPESGVIFDSSGNLYGTTRWGGSGGGGTVFKLTPSNGSWTFDLLYGLPGGQGPQASLMVDVAGSIYGTTSSDGAYGDGSAFKLTRSGSSWTYTSLHDFTNGSDSELPLSNLVFDSNGNLYGTANGGYSPGLVFEITP